MLVGVISDTHDVLDGVRSAVRFFREHGVEHVIHLGDYVAPFSLAELVSGLDGVPVTGVFGNNDGERMGLLKVAQATGVALHDQATTIELGGRRILLIHGFGPPENTREIVYSLASSRRWDAVLYGHTHQPDITYIRGVLVLNPGTASGILNRPTAALLDTRRMTARVTNL
ncbi:MAG: metallophosphoesterase [Desulfurococcales archaeon]|nr:metallophosphoesterase [Desulfurococcales archaeon]